MSDNRLEIKSDDQEIRIKVPSEYRDSNWAKYWNIDLNCIRIQGAAKKIKIDFSETLWVSPTPLMALLLACLEFSSNSKSCMLSLVLPGFDEITRSERGTVDPKKRLSTFLLYEGFVDALLTTFCKLEKGERKWDWEVYVKNGKRESRYEENTRDKLYEFAQQMSATELAFKDPECIPPRFFCIADLKEDRVNDIVNSLIDDARRYGLKVISDIAKNNDWNGSSNFLIEKLRQILRELLANTVEHAYSTEEIGSQFRFVGVYARVRLGIGDGRLSIEEREELKIHFNKELKFSLHPSLSAQIQQMGFLEVFVVDLGKGITRSIRDSITQMMGSKTNDQGEEFGVELAKFNDLSDKMDFLSSFLRSLLHDNRNLNDNEKFIKRFYEEIRHGGDKGWLSGIYHIGKLLREFGGFIRIITNDRWYADAFSSVKKSQYSGMHHGAAHKKVSTDLGVDEVGTYFLVRIPTDSMAKLPPSWTSPCLEFQKADEDPILSTYKNSRENSMKESIAKDSPICRIIDDQGRALIQEYFSNSNSLEDDYLKEIKLFEKSLNLPDDKRFKVFWRPQKGIRRESILEHLGSFPIDANSNLYVLDQDLSTSLMYWWTLEDLECSRAPKFCKITIISTGFCFVILEPRFKRIRGPQSQPVKVWTTVNPRNKIQGRSSYLKEVSKILRKLDSVLYWIAIEHGNTRQVSISERILWKKPQEMVKGGKYIQGYVDFIESVNIRLSRWVCRRALERLLCFLSAVEAPEAIDQLVEPILQRFKARPNRMDCGEKEVGQWRLFIGSVFVSGDTDSETVKFGTHETTNNKKVLVHFLRHPDSDLIDDASGTIRLWLLYWRDNGTGEMPGETSCQYARVLDSPFIGVGGNRTWIIKRKHTAKVLDGKSQSVQNIYGVSPDNPSGISTSESYQFWQNIGALNLGHWISGNHHDLFGLNLDESLRFDMLNISSPVHRFVISHMSRILPGYVPREDPRFPGDMVYFGKCHLMVFVSNRISSGIVHSFAKQHPDSEQNIFRFTYVQRTRKAMRLRINPLEIEHLKNRIEQLRKQEESVRILLFDSVISSQRTITELIDVLYEVGADDVDTVALVDRTRIQHRRSHIIAGEDGSRVPYYCKHARLWKFDLDFLGSSPNKSHVSGCYLCEARKTMLHLEQRIPSPHLKNRISKIRKLLKAGQVNAPKSFSGISTVSFDYPLAVGIGLKSQPQENPAEYFETISIRSSSALATLLQEILIQTGRHDLIDHYWYELDAAFHKGLPQEGDLNEMDNESKRKTKLNSARIQLVASQLIHLSNDIKSKRIFGLYKELLNLLADLEQNTGSSAFAVACFSNIESSVASALIDEAEKLLQENLEPSADVARHVLRTDFFISCYLISSRSSRAPQSLFLRIVEQLFSPVSRKSRGIIRELGYLLGTRNGEAHHSPLKILLTMDNANMTVVCDTLSNVVRRLKLLCAATNRFVFNKFSNIDNLLRRVDEMETKLDRLKKVRNTKKRDSLIEDIRVLLFGVESGDSIRTLFWANLTDNCIQFFKRLKDLQTDCFKKFSKSKDYNAGDVYFRYPRPSENSLKKIRIFMTAQTHYCIYEYVKNAYQKSNSSVKINMFVSEKENHGFEVKVTISNERTMDRANQPIDKETPGKAIDTIYTPLFEEMGGKVEDKSTEKEYVVELSFPTIEQFVSQS